MIYIIDIYY